MENILIEVDSLALPLQYEARSAVGGRSEQQDIAGVFASETALLSVVCDGMGGEADGKAAGQTALRAIHDSFIHRDDTLPAPDFLRLALEDADRRVYTQLHGEGGCTVVMTLIQGQSLFWASMGDSRLYIQRDGTLYCVTRDHNYFLQLEELRQAGQLTEQQYQRESQNGAALISFLGVGNVNLLDLTECPFQMETGDILLLATDGLYDVVPHEIIRDVLASKESLSTKADTLFGLVSHLTSVDEQDNYTFILVTS